MARKKQSPVVWIILALVLVGLVGFGSQNLSGTTNVIGHVGSQPITAQAYYNTLRQQIGAMSQQFGVQLTMQQAQALGIDRMVQAQLVRNAALDGETLSQGLSAGDARVAETIRTIPDFQGLSGTFDRDRYADVLQAQGLNEPDFETSIRNALARQLLDTAVVAGTPPQETFADAIAAWNGETRDVTWAPIAPDALTEPLPAPTDGELQALYNANPGRYTLPERRDITYAWLSPDAVQDRVTVDEADVRALYDSRAADFDMPERRLVERLVFPDQAAADAARAALDDGSKDFETLVADRGLDLADVDMGDVGPDDLGTAAEPVFAATVGDVAGPVETALGPALFRVNAVLAAQHTPFEEAAEELRGELANQRARRLISDLSEDMIDQLAGGATIEELAEANGMELGTIAWSEGATEGIAAYDDFRTAAAAVTADDFPELLEFDDGGVFAIRLDGIEPPALQPFDAVADQVTADWTAAATGAAILTEAERIAALVREGGGFDQPGLTLIPTAAPALRRTDFLEGTPETFVAGVFAMPPGAVEVVPAADGGAIIVRLDAVHAADMTDPAVAADRDRVATSAAEGISRDIQDAFATAIQLRTEVVLDEAAINSLNAQIQ